MPELACEHSVLLQTSTNNGAKQCQDIRGPVKEDTVEIFIPQISLGSHQLLVRITSGNKLTFLTWAQGG